MSQGFAGNGNMRIGGHRQGRREEDELRQKKTLEKRYRPTSQQVTFSFRLEPEGREESRKMGKARKMEKRAINPPKTVLWIGDEAPDCLDAEQLILLAGVGYQLTQVSLPRYRFAHRLVSAIEEAVEEHDIIIVAIDDHGAIRLLNQVKDPLFGEGLKGYFFIKIKGCLSRIFCLDGEQGHAWDMWINCNLESPREGIILPRIKLDFGYPELIAAWF